MSSRLIAFVADNFYRDISRQIRSDRPVVFYVGANVGQYITWMKRYLRRARLYCFEPFPDSYRKLTKRAARFDDVLTFNLGLSDQVGHLSVVPHEEPTKVRLVANGDPNLQKVPVSTVDRFCEEHAIPFIDLLKVDVEGFELEVLRGASGMLSAHRVDCVFLECGVNPDNQWHVPLTRVREYLEPMGYRILRFYEQMPEIDARETQLRRVDVAFISPRLRTPATR